MEEAFKKQRMEKRVERRTSRRTARLYAKADPSATNTTDEAGICPAHVSPLQHSNFLAYEPVVCCLSPERARCMNVACFSDNAARCKSHVLAFSREETYFLPI